MLTLDSGEEKIRASIGEIIYFKDRNVQIDRQPTSDIVSRGITLPDDTKMSPIVGELNYGLTPEWQAYSLAAWDPNNNIARNASLALQYKRDNKHLLNFGLNYIRGGDPEKYSDPLSNSNDLYQADVSAIWPLNKNISVLGRWNYKVSHDYTQSAFAGFQYDGCCWAVRVVGGREFLYQQIPVGGVPRPVFDNRFFVEFVLKGLGRIAPDNVHNMLKTGILGFEETMAPFSDY